MEYDYHLGGDDSLHSTAYLAGPASLANPTTVAVYQNRLKQQRASRAMTRGPSPRNSSTVSVIAEV